jgi:hypothetical protein
LPTRWTFTVEAQVRPEGEDDDGLISMQRIVIDRGDLDILLCGTQVERRKLLDHMVIPILHRVADSVSDES